jgi:hypothetical protein
MVLGQAGAEKHSKQRANTMKPMAIEFMADPLRKSATDSHYNLAGRTNIDLATDRGSFALCFA